MYKNKLSNFGDLSGENNRFIQKSTLKFRNQFKIGFLYKYFVVNALKNENFVVQCI